MIKKNALPLILSLCVGISVCTGCSEAVSEVEDIALVEPVGVVADVALCEERDLVVSKTYAGKVVPTVTEVSFSTDQKFSKYGSLPGDTVNKGDTIIYASTEAIDKEIDNFKESVAKKEEEFLEYLTDANKDLDSLKGDERRYGEICDNFEGMNDAEKASYGGKGYVQEYADYSFRLANATAQRQHVEEGIKEKSELYFLDADFDQKTLKRLNDKRNKVLANATINGVVVAVNFFDDGARINKKESVAAVGDFNSLVIATELIYKGDIKKAVDLFAIVNGKRYEIEPIEESNKETENKASFSAFKIVDPEGEVKVGDYAAVTLVSERKENVLCVPNNAIVRDADGAGVYLDVNGESVFTPVKTGLKSGFYTEIQSGLFEGDKVFSEFKVKADKGTATLSKGSTSTDFKESGYIFYSKNEYVNNPVKYGTAYIDELLVSRYERVEKGQVIAKIHVVSDKIGIARQERLILRATEDLLKLQEENDSEGKNNKAIKKKLEYISDIQKVVDEMKRDEKLVSIVAPYSGIITYVNDYKEGDILLPESRIVMLADENSCFIYVEDKSGILTCGNEAEILFKDENNKDKVVLGEVVTVAPMTLSENLRTGYALIKVSNEDFAVMAALNQGNDGWWMRSRFDVKVKTRSMDNVVLVPKTAVTLSEGTTYVAVKDSNGNLTYKEFISGGGDATNYWAVEGLEEGMTICLD